MTGRLRKTAVSTHLAATLFEGVATEVYSAASPEVWQTEREEDLSRARVALDEAPHNPDRLNALGLALLALAGPNADSRALGAIEEAQRRFSRAEQEATRQSATAAACRRFRINRAFALCTLGERRNEQTTLEHALEILAPVLQAINAESTSGLQMQVDWARALDIKGNALAALGKTDAAIDAYDAALGKTREPGVCARILRNLAITLAGVGRHADASERLGQGLVKISRSKEPLAWARLQRTVGDVLYGWAETLQEDSQQAERYFSKAVTAYHAARDAYGQAEAHREALSLSVLLATAEVQLGARLCMSPDLADRQAGLATIEDATSGLAASVREIPPEGREKARQAVEIARQILDYISGSYKPTGNNESIPLDNTVIIRNSCGIIESVANDNTNIFSDIVERLSGLPVAERQELLRALAARFDMPLREAAEELTAPSQETPRLTLPDEAPKLYKDRPKGQNIIDFLRDPDGWGPYVASGVLSRPDLGRLDRQAYAALAQWLHFNHSLPPDIRVPSRSETFPDTHMPPDAIRAAARLAKRSYRQRVTRLS
jgi:tetratricopeptide (TPR) repeat protein